MSPSYSLSPSAWKPSFLGLENVSPRNFLVTNYLVHCYVPHSNNIKQVDNIYLFYQRKFAVGMLNSGQTIKSLIRKNSQMSAMHA